MRSYILDSWHNKRFHVSISDCREQNEYRYHVEIYCCFTPPINGWGHNRVMTIRKKQGGKIIYKGYFVDAFLTNSPLEAYIAFKKYVQRYRKGEGHDQSVSLSAVWDKGRQPQ